MSFVHKIIYCAVQEFFKKHFRCYAFTKITKLKLNCTFNELKILDTF